MGCSVSKKENLPKKIDGTISNNIYFSPQHTFRISLPHPETSPIFKSMAVYEGGDQKLSYVSFAPFLMDQNRYHVFVAKTKLSGPLEEQGEAIIKTYIERQNKLSQEAFKVFYSEKVSLNGIKSIYSIYKSESRYQVFYLTDHGERFSNIIVELNPESILKFKPTEQVLVKRKWVFYNDFVNSLEIQ